MLNILVGEEMDVNLETASDEEIDEELMQLSAFELGRLKRAVARVAATKMQILNHNWAETKSPLEAAVAKRAMLELR